MKVILSKGDIHNLQRFGQALINEIGKIDPSALEEFIEKDFDYVETIKEVAVQYPKLLTVTEVDDELIIEYAESFLGDMVDLVIKVAPVVLPIVKGIYDLIGMFGTALESIGEYFDELFESYK